VKLVPAPDGSTVVDVAFEFVQEMELAYWPSVLDEPAAITSLNVYVPAAASSTPVVALRPAPEVVAVPTVDAPVTTLIVNWSAALIRLTMVLFRVSRG